MAGRPTKYAHVTANLPKLDAIEPERRQVVDAVKAEILAPEAATDPPLILLRENMEEASDAVENAIAVAKRATRGRRYASEFARGYAEVRGMKDALKAWESSVQVLLDAYEELMIEQFEVEGVASIRMEDGGSVSTYSEPYPQVQDKEAYRLWCIAQGMERDMHLWPSKTAALVKEMLLAGEAEPPGVVAYAKTLVRLNKA